MRYTLEDIRALVSVEKKIIEEDNAKKENALEIALEKLNKVDLTEYYDILMGFDRRIDFNFNGHRYNRGHEYMLKGKKNTYYVNHWANGQYVEISVCCYPYEKSISEEMLFRYKYFKDGKIETDASRYLDEYKIDFANVLLEHLDEIKDEYELVIQKTYEEKLTKIMNIANKEY